MIWAQVSDGTQTKKLAFMALPRQGEVISAAISTPGPYHHRVITVLHMSQLDPQILVARMKGDCMEDDCNDD